MKDQLLFHITFWEIPGKERYLKFFHHYCMGSAFAFIIFDTSKSNSLERAEKILQNLEICDIPSKILIGNKVKKSSSNLLLG